MGPPPSSAVFEPKGRMHHSVHLSATKAGASVSVPPCETGSDEEMGGFYYIPEECTKGDRGKSTRALLLLVQPWTDPSLCRDVPDGFQLLLDPRNQDECSSCAPLRHIRTRTHWYVLNGRIMKFSERKSTSRSPLYTCPPRLFRNWRWTSARSCCRWCRLGYAFDSPRFRNSVTIVNCTSDDKPINVSDGYVLCGNINGPVEIQGLHEQFEHLLMVLRVICVIDHEWCELNHRDFVLFFLVLSIRQQSTFRGSLTQRRRLVVLHCNQTVNSLNGKHCIVAIGFNLFTIFELGWQKSGLLIQINEFGKPLKIHFLKQKASRTSGNWKMRVSSLNIGQYLVSRRVCLIGWPQGTFSISVSCCFLGRKKHSFTRVEKSALRRVLPNFCSLYS